MLKTELLREAYHKFVEPFELPKYELVIDDKQMLTSNKQLIELCLNQETGQEGMVRLGLVKKV